MIDSTENFKQKQKHNSLKGKVQTNQSLTLMHKAPYTWTLIFHASMSRCPACKKEFLARIK